VTWSDWSHVAILEGEKVVEAVWPKVRETTLAALVAKHETCLIVDFPTPGKDAEIMALALTQVGKAYDLAGVLGLWWHRNWQEDDAWWCSELPEWCCQKVGIKHFRASAVKRITPQHWWMISVN